MNNKNYLKNSINGLLDTFISRNNDVDGYWGIGKLYSLMISRKIEIIEIDLKSKTIFPNKKEFETMISKYSNWIFEKIKNKDIDSLNALKITLTSLPNYNKPYSLNKINCKISFIDSLDKEYSLSRDVMCRKHNPNIELKRNK